MAAIQESGTSGVRQKQQAMLDMSRASSESRADVARVDEKVMSVLRRRPLRAGDAATPQAMGFLAEGESEGRAVATREAPGLSSMDMVARAEAVRAGAKARGEEMARSAGSMRRMASLQQAPRDVPIYPSGGELGADPVHPATDPTVTLPEPPLQPGDPAQPTQTQPRTELEGGKIPTTTDEWKSKQQWEEYGRRQETVAGLRKIAELREQAELDASKSEVTLRRAGVADDRSTQALAEAQVALQRAGADAADQERLAEIAGLNVDALQAEQASRALERGEITTQSAAAIGERQLKMEGVAAAASEAIQDTELATAREQAEANVMAHARGAGGQAVEAQAASRTVQQERQIGRIGRKARNEVGQLRQQVKGLESRAKVAVARLDAAQARGDTAIETQRLHRTSAEERAEVIEEQGRVASDKLKLAAASFEADAADLRLDAEAQRVSGEFAQQAADEGMEALINRPPIPDWNAIGRKRESQQRWQRAAGIAGVVDRVLSWVF